MIKINDKTLIGKAYTIFNEKEETLNSNERKMKPWKDEIYKY